MAKRLFILSIGLIVLFVLVGLKTAQSRTDDIARYNEYYNEFGETINSYLIGDKNREDLINFLNDFHNFLREANIPEELKEKQISALKLYKEGLEQNNAEKITKAAHMSFEVYRKINAK
ncbi:hypothetical protein [Caldibacillus phage CBP1]|uniref:Uncharacterized protein n=1 Tax=Caldibacillus debilis GB1 TaxID=1339248 RepID=A0A420VJM1_9BACI|nr:hypothetical protein [Caldibacillus debilis]ATB52743.1 hypothetical protein [Caldibacillus phage CBP1]RKO63568.1 hypothetical protein Cdeb_02830 [Caldibacillus debilis GB1]